jgi:peroxiredoxin
MLSSKRIRQIHQKPQKSVYNQLNRFKSKPKTGVAHLFGLSTQDTGYQRELATNAHLPFPLLSDQLLGLTKALRLPTMEVGGETMIKRLALVLDSGVVSKVLFFFYILMNF